MLEWYYMTRNNKKLKVAILFGGKSVEHEVSLMSAKNVASAIDKDRYEIVYIGIDKKGQWFKCGDDFKIKGVKINSIYDLGIDVVFPILHGPFGEDGTVQGLLKVSGVPFVGPSVLGSAIGFDKDVTKRLLNEANIPNVKFLTFKARDDISFNNVRKILGLPLIIKPANSGSSIGISKVNNEKQFKYAIKHAFLFDSKILIEKFIENKREIECAVLGNENPKASICGEVVTNKKHKFYSYEAKYFDENGANLIIPAQISKQTETKIRELAVNVFNTLELEGMTRVDFFMDKDNNLFVNEVNTIPGFTNISMYPTLWGKTGIDYKKLINILIDLAIKRFKREQKLKTSVN